MQCLSYCRTQGILNQGKPNNEKKNTTKKAQVILKTCFHKRQGLRMLSNDSTTTGN